MQLLIVALFSTLFSTLYCEESFCNIAAPPPTTYTYANNQRNEVYDYIVVGGGASGAVVASRLSENPNVTVLLLEAGGPPPIISEVPICKFKLEENKDTDWGYYTEPQEKACLGEKDRRTLYSRYKALGGCSSHNGMMYARGSHKDYDRWAEMGATGWSWKDLLPIFKKSENNTDPKLAQNGFHGTDGYQTVSPPMYESEIRQAYFSAGKAFNLNEVDYNGESQFGFSALQLAQRNGDRCSTEKAFLRPAANRPNLDVLPYARVTKIEFDEESDGSKTAKRVVYNYQNQTTQTVGARREIVMSAGAIGSPHILLLSGIGPKEDLMKLGIPVVADLPVGLNLQDHVLASGHAWALNSSVGIVLARDITDKAISDFKEGKGGILTAPETMENVFFINTTYSTEDWPDIEILTRSSLFPKSVDQLSQYRSRDATQILTFLLRPKSRGFVKLRTTDPYDNPILDPKFLSEEDDLVTLVAGMKFSADLVASAEFQKFGPVPIREIAPDCNASESEWNSLENLACIARYTTIPGLHACCTTKMGSPDDKTTVVDPRLRVKGVKGLRVADASIMPALVSGNTNAPCVMIGEMAALLISQDYSN